MNLILDLITNIIALHKSGFQDALVLRYDWPLKDIPSSCPCGHQLSIEHALSCPMGRFPTICHNEVRDITASLLTEVCHDVSIEPHLQPLTEELLQYRTANVKDDARLDTAANGFWGGRFEKAFFYVRLFNPCAQSNHQSSLQATYKKNMNKLKRRHYDQRVHEIEQGNFTPLVFSTTGDMGKAATTYKTRFLPLRQKGRELQSNYGLTEISPEFCFIAVLNYVHQRCSLLNEQTNSGQSF